MNNNDVNCPVDNVTVNENKVRLVAFFVLLLAIAYLVSASWGITAILLIDFVLRALNLNKYSPLGIISGIVVKTFNIKNKVVDRAPKRFAAMVGALFSAIVIITLVMHLILASKIIAAVLVLFASLESFMGFCAGCYVYNILKQLKLIEAS